VAVQAKPMQIAQSSKILNFMRPLFWFLASTIRDRRFTQLGLVN
jgi:hypothetical protein